MATSFRPSPAQREFIDAAIRAACRRHRLRPGDAEDYASIARLRVSKGDRRVLRGSRGRGASRTRLVALLARAFVEWQQARWGAWRPSDAARRLGPLAIQLDTLMSRDGFSADEAIETMWARRSGAESREQLEALSARLPGRTAAAGARVSRAASGAAPAMGAPAGDAGEGAVPPRDRLVLKMRFEDDFGASDIARALALDEKTLSRQLGQRPGEARAGHEAPGVPIQAHVDGPERAGRAGREQHAARDAATGSGCLDAERLADFLDGRVNPAQRERIEAHLAGCGACYDVFVEAIRLQAFLAEDSGVRRAARRGRLRRRAAIAGAGFALAAAVWMVAPPPAAPSPGEARRVRPRPKP